MESLFDSASDEAGVCRISANSEWGTLSKAPLSASDGRVIHQAWWLQSDKPEVFSPEDSIQSQGGEGVSKTGEQLILPLQAKRTRDKVGIIQLEQDLALCESKFPTLT